VTEFFVTGHIGESEDAVGSTYGQARSLRFEDADARKARPCVYLIRAATAALRAFVGPWQHAREHFARAGQIFQ
jgi:hypothetical protein